MSTANLRHLAFGMPGWYLCSLAAHAMQQWTNEWQRPIRPLAKACLMIMEEYSHDNQGLQTAIASKEVCALISCLGSPSAARVAAQSSFVSEVKPVGTVSTSPPAGTCVEQLAVGAGAAFTCPSTLPS